MLGQLGPSGRHDRGVARALSRIERIALGVDPPKDLGLPPVDFHGPTLGDGLVMQQRTARVP